MQNFSIVVPTKNEEKYLPKLLDSIKSQSLQPKEIIVADAKSKDRTRDIAENFGAKIVDGGMPGVGRNKGAYAVTSDLILFLDADVEFSDRDFLKKAWKDFNDQNLDVGSADVQPLSSNLYDRFSHWVYNKYVRLWGSRRPHAPGFCIFVKKKLHDQINGFDEGIIFAEDHEYAYRASKIGRFGFLDGVKILVSVRRMDRDGRLKIAIKYISAELHLLFLGPIRDDKFKYTFEHNEDYEEKR